MITKQTINSNYKPNLAEFISQCEDNYYLIIKLLPFLDTINTSSLKSKLGKKFSFSSDTGYRIEFTLVESARYTTSILLNMRLPELVEQSNVSLYVRFYHDAKLLEVMDEDGPKAIKPLIKRKTEKYHQTDEKKQLNLFIGESLQFCISNCIISNNKEASDKSNCSEE